MDKRRQRKSSTPSIFKGTAHGAAVMSQQSHSHPETVARVDDAPARLPARIRQYQFGAVVPFVLLHVGCLAVFLVPFRWSLAGWMAGA